MPKIEIILLISATLVLLSIAASKVSSRYGIPSLLLFVGLGMLAGSDGLGGIYFDHPWATQFIGVVALVIILFTAGIETELHALRPIVWRGLSLSTVGVCVSAALIAWLSTFLLGWNWKQGLLLGSIISSTDAAAVFDLLRTRDVRLKSGLKETIELESGSNDPMAVLLTVSMIQLITVPETTLGNIVWNFALQVAVGLVAGYIFGHITRALVNWIRLESEGLYPILTLTMALLTYAATAALGGSGFVAVYLAGLVVGGRKLIRRTTLRFFHEGMSWLLQIALFLVLGLQVFPSHLPAIAPAGLAMTFFLMFVARPVSVFAALPIRAVSWREKLVISWAGLRGAAPIILATFPLLAGVQFSREIFNVVFFVALASLLLQGTSLPWITRKLKLEGAGDRELSSPIFFNPAAAGDSEMVEIRITEGSPAIGRRIVDLRLPEHALVLSITRADEFVIPQGSTVLKANDLAVVLAAPSDIAEVRRKFAASA